jgi:hypothetical protein
MAELWPDKCADPLAWDLITCVELEGVTQAKRVSLGDFSSGACVGSRVPEMTAAPSDLVYVLGKFDDDLRDRK